MYPRNVVCFRYIILNALHKGDKKDDDDKNDNNSDDYDDNNDDDDDDDDKLRDQSSIQKCHTNTGLISSNYRGMNIYSNYRAADILSKCCAMSI